MLTFLRATLLGASLAGAAIGSASAAGMAAGFDSGTEGFFITGDGELTHLVSAGNGFLSVKDTTGSFLFLNAPVAAGGEDWSAYFGGNVSFDAIMLNGISPSWPDFGTITFTSTSGQSASFDLAPQVGSLITEPGPTWKTYSASLTNAVFSQGTAPLSTVLTSLSGVQFSMEAADGPIEVIGFDNFKVITPVPEPESWALGLVGLAVATGMAARRRRP